MSHHQVVRDGTYWACLHCPGRWPYPDPVPASAGPCITRTWDPGVDTGAGQLAERIAVKTIEQMTKEIRENVIAKGFRPATGGPGLNTWGDYVALLHTEVSEMLEAYRSWRLESIGDTACTVSSCPRFGKTPTASDCAGKPDRPGHSVHINKPEGVGSEAADVLIRLLDMADVFGFRLASPGEELADALPVYPASGMPSTFGGMVAWLHGEVAKLYPYTIEIPTVTIRNQARFVLRSLVALSQRCEIDLMAEYERKMAYNRTRPYQHGGRTLADSPEGSR